MICPNCGNQIPDEARFCTSCGFNLAAEQQVPVMPEPIPEQAPDFPANEQIPSAEQTYMPAPNEAVAEYESAPTEAVQESLSPDAFVPEALPQEAYAQNEPAFEPVPVQMPEQTYQHAPDAKPAKEKRSGGFGKILPWILVGLLVIGAGVGGYFFYREYNKVADQRDEYYLANKSLQEDYDELDEQYKGKEDSYDDLSDKAKQKDDEINRLNDQLNEAEDTLSNYDDILRYAEVYNIGGSNLFGVSPAVLYLDIDSGSEYVTLYTGFEGKTVSWDSYGYSAYLDFSEDNWNDVTTLEITPAALGVTLFTFAVDDGSYPEFALLVIVTDG